MEQAADTEEAHVLGSLPRDFVGEQTACWLELEEMTQKSRMRSFDDAGKPTRTAVLPRARRPEGVVRNGAARGFAADLLEAFRRRPVAFPRARPRVEAPGLSPGARSESRRRPSRKPRVRCTKEGHLDLAYAQELKWEGWPFSSSSCRDRRPRPMPRLERRLCRVNAGGARSRTDLAHRRDQRARWAETGGAQDRGRRLIGGQIGYRSPRADHLLLGPEVQSWYGTHIEARHRRRTLPARRPGADDEVARPGSGLGGGSASPASKRLAYLRAG